VEEQAIEASVISCCIEIQDTTISRLTIFWDSQGPIPETYLEHGTPVKSATYCDMLQGGLKPAIRSKGRGRLSEGVLLLHDNARPHTATCTLETLRKLKWEVMEHPAHSPDLAPSDFSPFWTA
jgi:histone-lysine N-methyltransferase SETMAR